MMFNNLMFYLNFISPRIPQFIRYVLTRVLPNKFGWYESDAMADYGYVGWVEVPIFGVTAFIRTEGDWLQHKW